MKLPRFTLRELFLLVVIAALGCGWWVERARIQREQEELMISRQEFANERERFLSVMRQAGLLQVDYYQSLLQVCERELANAVEANRSVAGTVPKMELARLEAQVRTVRLDAENVRVAAEYLSASKNSSPVTVPPSPSSP